MAIRIGPLAAPCANGRTSRMHGLPARGVAVGQRRLAVVALERAREVQRVVEADAVGDLADGEVGEAQQPRRLEHHAVGDELLGRAAGDVR